jgi:hypothetical protein
MSAMTRQLLALLLSFATVLSSCSKNASPGTTRNKPGNQTESSAYIVDELKSRTYVTDNGSFHFVEVLGDKGDYEAVLLLEEHYRNENTPGVEGMRGEATVTAWTIGAFHQKELRWTAHEKANEGVIRERFYRFTALGCCDSPNVYTYFSILSGKKLYVTNSDLLEIWGNGEGPLLSRFVGFGYDVRNPSDPQIQYGTDKDVAQRFSIHSDKAEYERPEVFAAMKDKLEMNYLDLRGSETSFVIVLRYPGHVELRIPVENDAIRPEKAILPRGYSISNVEDPQNIIDEVHLRATVQAVVPLADFSGEITPVDFDPKFALTVHIESVVPAVTNFAAGSVATFAVHSPSLLFGGAATKGNTYEFSLQHKIEDGKIKFFGLKVVKI